MRHGYTKSSEDMQNAWVYLMLSPLSGFLLSQKVCLLLPAAVVLLYGSTRSEERIFRTLSEIIHPIRCQRNVKTLEERNLQRCHC